MFKKDKENHGLLAGIFTAYSIIIFHIFLIGGIGLLVLFLRGVVNYMVWIFLGGILIIGLLGYLFYRKIKREGSNLNELIKNPIFRGRSVEINFLNGVASFKLGSPSNNPENQILIDQINYDKQNYRQLEDTETIKIRDLTELSRLLEKNYITIEEYNRAKDKILNN